VEFDSGAVDVSDGERTNGVTAAFLQDMIKAVGKQHAEEENAQERKRKRERDANSVRLKKFPRKSSNPLVTLLLPLEQGGVDIEAVTKLAKSEPADLLRRDQEVRARIVRVHAVHMVLT
jgi:hypothetical protein